MGSILRGWQDRRDLQSLGFKVVHECVDFFENNLGDIVVSNPPFSKKAKVLERLVELQKPLDLPGTNCEKLLDPPGAP